MNIRRMIALGIVFASLLATVADAAEKRLDRTFKVMPGGDLNVKVNSGNIKVKGSNANQVVVHMLATGSQNYLDQLKLSADASGNTVSVVAEHESQSLFGWLRMGSHRIEVTVEVPRQFSVDLKTSGGDLDISQVSGTVIGKTSGGDIRLSQLAGSVRAQTSGGDVTAEHIEGDTWVHTSGGRIKAESIDGKLDVGTSGGGIHLGNINGDTVAHTSSGDFSVAGIRGDSDLSTSGGDIRATSLDGKIRVHTSGGDIDVELVGANRGIDASTSGGDITLRLPANTGAAVDARTTGGSVRSDLPVTTADFGKKSLKGKINDGGESIQARTSGGDIHLRISAGGLERD